MAAGALLHMHAHRCESCGAVWRHKGDRFGDLASHLCPKCGDGPFWAHSGGPVSPLVLVGLGLAVVGLALVFGRD